MKVDIELSSSHINSKISLKGLKGYGSPFYHRWFVGCFCRYFRGRVNYQWKTTYILRSLATGAGSQIVSKNVMIRLQHLTITVKRLAPLISKQQTFRFATQLLVCRFYSNNDQVVWSTNGTVCRPAQQQIKSCQLPMFVRVHMYSMHRQHLFG